MCGRYVFFALGSYFRIDHSWVDPKPSYNIAPSQEVPAIIRENDENILLNLHWGLVPFWAKDKSIGNHMINARMETIAEKPAFRAALNKRRCLIPANGFYEWSETAGKKQPYYITLPSEEPFAFAGIWDVWDKEEPPFRSCSIITTGASKSIEEIHQRMPVILKPDSHDKWMDPETKDFLGILQTGGENELKYHPVSTRVNKAENNDPGCIEPIKPTDMGRNK